MPIRERGWFANREDAVKADEMWFELTKRSIGSQ